MGITKKDIETITVFLEGLKYHVVTDDCDEEKEEELTALMYADLLTLAGE